MSSKLPALPPRPQARKVLYNGIMFDYHEAKSHMDAQDARIAELVSTSDLVPELELLAKKRADRIAELERDIRELKSVRDAAAVRICEDGKDSWAFRAEIDQLKLQIRNAYDILHKCGNYRTRKWWSSRSEWMEYFKGFAREDIETVTAPSVSVDLPDLTSLAKRQKEKRDFYPAYIEREEQLTEAITQRDTAHALAATHKSTYDLNLATLQRNHEIDRADWEPVLIERIRVAEDALATERARALQEAAIYVDGLRLKLEFPTKFSSGRDSGIEDSHAAIRALLKK